MTTDHHRHIGNSTTSGSNLHRAIWVCRVCYRTNGRGWQVCRSCGTGRPARHGWMRSLRSLRFLITAVASAAVGVVVLNAWAAVISGPWVLPAIGVWVLGCLAVPIVAWMRRAKGAS